MQAQHLGAGPRAAVLPAGPARSSRAATQTRAFFGKKSAAPVMEEPAAPAKRGLFGRGGNSSKQAAAAPKQVQKKPLDKATEYE